MKIDFPCLLFCLPYAIPPPAWLPPPKLRMRRRGVGREFVADTGLRAYPRYFLGGGYLLTGDVVRALGTLARAIPLHRWPVEVPPPTPLPPSLGAGPPRFRRFWSRGERLRRVLPMSSVRLGS